MKRFILGTFILVITFIFIAFNIKPSIKEQSEPELSSNHLIDKGYEIVDYIGRTTISFSEDHISLNDIYRLTLINDNYKNFTNKEIIIDTYMVTNHPLDNNLKRFIRTIQMGLRVKYPNMTRVQVAIVDNEIIGGNSNIHYTGQMMLGATPYDLEGKSIETKTGVTYDAWRENVMKEFKINY
jgi:hypothetical protein